MGLGIDDIEGIEGIEGIELPPSPPEIALKAINPHIKRIQIKQQAHIGEINGANIASPNIPNKLPKAAPISWIGPVATFSDFDETVDSVEEVVWPIESVFIPSSWKVDWVVLEIASESCLQFCTCSTVAVCTQLTLALPSMSKFDKSWEFETDVFPIHSLTVSALKLFDKFCWKIF